MLSQAHLLTNLFETIETKPINYLQAVQDLMTTDPWVPPKLHDAPYELDSTLNKADVDMVLDLSKITDQSVQRYRSAFHALGEFVAKRKTEVEFPGLKTALEIHTKDQCCTWSTRQQIEPKRELIQLLAAIKSQSKPSRKRYVIQVVNG